MAKSKVPLQRLYANDLEIVLGEETYRPHFGEWVELAPFATFDEMLLQAEIRKGDASDEVIVDRQYRAVVRRVKAWDWTDDTGEPMPQPSEDVIRSLTPPEIGWLMRALRGSAGMAGADDEPGNDGSPLPLPLKGEGTRQPSSASRRSAKSSGSAPAKRSSRTRAS